MSQSISVTHKSKAARAENKPRGTRRLDRGTSQLVASAIRMEERQQTELTRIAKGLMMQRADLIRMGLDLAIEWGNARMVKIHGKRQA